MEKAAYGPISSSEDCTDILSTLSYEVSLWRRRCFMALGLATMFILLLLGVAMGRIQSVQNCYLPTTDVVIPYCKHKQINRNMADRYIVADRVIAPAPVRYVNRWIMDDPESSRFSGEPRPELDQAWHEMLDGTLIRFSEEELLQANNATSVRSKDGGYIGSIGVSHSLHCLVSSALGGGSHTYLIRISLFIGLGFKQNEFRLFHGPQNTANLFHRKESSSTCIPTTITAATPPTGRKFMSTWTIALSHFVKNCCAQPT